MPKVLVIEDEVSIASMYKFKLEQSGYEVDVAYNGQEGLKKAEEIKPELIILDLRMPVMTGDEMLEELRKQEWGKNIRCVVMTNISKDEAPTILRLLAVDRYVVKAHHTPSQLVDIVNEVLGKKVTLK